MENKTISGFSQVAKRGVSSPWLVFKGVVWHEFNPGRTPWTQSVGWMIENQSM